jgi:hypothetical protein
MRFVAVAIATLAPAPNVDGIPQDGAVIDRARPAPMLMETVTVHPPLPAGAARR